MPKKLIIEIEVEDITDLLNDKMYNDYCTYEWFINYDYDCDYEDLMISILFTNDNGWAIHSQN